MICYLVAFPSEANPLIRHLRLKKIEKTPYPLYSNENKNLVITGPGKIRAAMATGWLGGFLRGASAVWLNMGIAGHRNAPLGNLYLSSKIQDFFSGDSIYPQLIIKAPWSRKTCITVDQIEREYPQDSLYEMEAYGFAMAASRFATLEFIQTIKIISDNSALPIEKVQYKETEDLIKPHLFKISEFSENLVSLMLKSTEDEGELIAPYLNKWHFTTNQKNQLVGALRRLQALNLKISSIPCKNAAEVLIYLQNVLTHTPYKLEDK
jgi:adenosylhomocysteine nucleosidase